MTTIKLIAGEFTPAEGKEILLKMVESKISFHRNESFSTYVRFGHQNHNSELRIKELTEAKKQIISFIQEANDRNIDLKIESNISLSFVEAVPTDDSLKKYELVAC